MIKSIATQTDLPNFEQVSLVGLCNSEPLDALIVRADITTEQQTVYDAYTTLGTDKVYFNIENYPDPLSLTRFTSAAVTVDEEEILDWNTMDQADKDTITNFCDLAIEFNTI